MHLYNDFRCDNGWMGLNCSEPTFALPTYLYDSFDPDVNETQWVKIVGAQAIPPCKVMAAGNAMHFSGVRWCSYVY
jgi:reelin